MSSPRSREAAHGLELVPGRELVFCHACQNEWYRDDHPGPMRCPTCGSEAVEIVDADNDPRPRDDALLTFGARHHPHRHDEEDPDEEDIEEHITHHPGGFFMRQAVFGSQSRPRGEQAGLPGRRRPTDPTNNNEMVLRFNELLAALGVPAAGYPVNDPFADRAPPPPGVFDAPQRARPFRTPLSSASVTITTGVPTRREAGGPADYGSVFGSILSSSPVPGGDRRGPGENPVPIGFNFGLQDLVLSLFDPSRAVRGDAVYTQEALDRIITTLMDVNPQSNAAPPASQAAIERLQKKKVDSEMLGSDGRIECTICIDELQVGDEVTVLPCKHWFHEECVVLWLKEHNTCPICRAAIEQRSSTGAAGGSRSQDTAASIFGQPRPQDPLTPGPPPPELETGLWPQAPGGFFTESGATGSQSARRQRVANADWQERLNRIRSAREASRNYSASSSSQSLGGAASGQSGSRRTSNSPPSVRTSSLGQQQPSHQSGSGSSSGGGGGGRRHSQHQGGSLPRDRSVRDRSPSHSRRPRDAVPGSAGSGPGGPGSTGVVEAGLHWLRGHLGGGGGGGGSSSSGGTGSAGGIGGSSSSNNNPDRDRRRS